MRGTLVGLAVLASFIILIALVRVKPSQPARIEIITASAISPDTSLQNLSDSGSDSMGSSTIKMPEPIVIGKFLDVSKIKDPNLRSLVRRKTNFKVQKVLYFEWHGGPDDKMEGNLLEKENKYVVTLHPTTGSKKINYRQVFVVPLDCKYDVEIAKAF